MGVKTESDTGQHQRLEDVKKLASRIMHMHYCEHDIEGITSCFFRTVFLDGGWRAGVFVRPAGLRGPLPQIQGEHT